MVFSRSRRQMAWPRLVAITVAVLGLIGSNAVLAQRGQRGRGQSTTPAPPDTKAPPDRPRGLFAVIDWNGVPSAATWNNPLLSGVVIRTYWRDVQKGPREFDWSYLDAQLRAAADHHKRVHVMIAPGFYSPTFVLSDSKVKTAKFDLPAGPNKVSAAAQAMPLPWDAAYEAYWFQFVDALGQRYRNHAGLGYVSITGPNAHNGEISMPRDAADEAEWRRLVNNDPNELERRLGEAWHRAIDRFCTDFKGKQVTLAIINESLPLSVGARSEARYIEDLAAYGASHYAATFGLQTNGLDSATGKTPEMWTLIQSYAGKIFVGFQTRAPSNLYRGAGRTAASDKVRAYRETLLVNGVSHGADFIEVYEDDADDPALADLLGEVRAKLVPGPPSSAPCPEARLCGG
jgi:hypothetical protein